MSAPFVCNSDRLQDPSESLGEGGSLPSGKQSRCGRARKSLTIFMSWELLLESATVLDYLAGLKRRRTLVGVRLSLGTSTVANAT